MANDFGIGEAIQTFMQMRQWRDQQHAAATASRTNQVEWGELTAQPPAATPMPGATPMPPAAMGPPAAMAPPQSRVAPELAAMFDQVLGKGGGMPGATPMPGGPAGPPQGQPAGPGGVSAMAPPPAAMAPPPAPRDPNLSGVAAPTGNPVMDTHATLVSMARAIDAAYPNEKPEVKMAVLRAQIADMRGLAPEQKAQMNFQLGQDNNSARKEREEIHETHVDDRNRITVEGKEYVADENGNFMLQREGMKGKTATTVQGMKGKTATTVQGMRGKTSVSNTRYRGEVTKRGQDLTHGDRTAAEAGRNSRVDSVEWGKMRRAAITAGRPDPGPQPPKGGSGAGAGYASLGALQAAVSQGKVSVAEATAVAKAKGWAQ